MTFRSVKRLWMQPGVALVLSLALMVPSIALLAQQGGTTRYVYDDNGRLIAVISPSGESALYEYDPAGNFTAIRRLDANALRLLSFSPHQGTAGDRVTFYGVGFGGGVNSVTFNGANAPVVETSASTVVALVPEGATTGLVTITTPQGSVSTSSAFTILPRIRVSPTTAGVVIGETAQFAAVVTSLSGDRTVRWSVNGIEGGNSTVGTMTAAGLYTAPAQLTPLVVVRATSVAVPSLFGEAQVTIKGPDSVQALLAPAVSVQRGSTTGTGSIGPAAVSVRYGNQPNAAMPLSNAVSVRRGATQGASDSQSQPISLTSGPYVSSVSPIQSGRGITVTLNLAGANLTGATDLRFLLSTGSLDSTITASNITVNAEGTSLSATVAVSGSSPAGRRVVLVASPAGISPTFDLGSNIFEILP